MTDYQDDPRRAKRRNETDLEYRRRVEQLDREQRDMSGPLVTPEAERHGDYRDGFVLHIETNTLAHTKRNRDVSPFLRLYDNGQIDKDQFAASQEIAEAARQRTIAMGIRGPNYEARVDNSGNNRDELLERLSAVQLEISYSRWRDGLPMPRAMYVDMLTSGVSLFTIARRHKMGWPKARKRLIRVLDLWIEVRDRVAKEVDQDDLDAAHMRLRRKQA